MAWAADGAARTASKTHEEQRGALDAAGGDPAVSELLAQIAKCLPPNLRPHLPAQHLVLKIGATGALEAAPMIDSSFPLLTAEDRASADKVVQAVLQCGPYAKADNASEAISLPVDFSNVDRKATP